MVWRFGTIDPDYPLPTSTQGLLNSYLLPGSSSYGVLFMHTNLFLHMFSSARKRKGKTLEVAQNLFFQPFSCVIKRISISLGILLVSSFTSFSSDFRSWSTYNLILELNIYQTCCFMEMAAMVRHLIHFFMNSPME